MLNIGGLVGEPVRPVLAAFSAFAMIDLSLQRLGATRDRHPAMWSGKWIDHLAWGADSACVAARLLFSGQYVGAAAILRSQFERWTENVAFNARVEHRTGESFAEFSARAWSTLYSKAPCSAEPDLPSVDGDSWEEEGSDERGSDLSVQLGKDYYVYPARLMNEMSEILHGRPGSMNATRWEASSLLEGESKEGAKVSSLLADVMMLNLRQVRVCLATLAEETGDSHTAHGLLALPELVYAGESPPPLRFLIPLHPKTGLGQDIVSELKAVDRNYSLLLRGQRPAGRLYRDDEMAMLSFGERRARAARWSLRSFEMEKRRLGQDFDIDSLSGREFPYVLAGEMAGLLAIWLGDSMRGNAAAICSSAMRSAYWLWLEDDDRSLAVMRVILEQCARLKTWSTRPDKAEKLENSTSTTPKDWLDAAGWRRLTAFNRALGEFAHAHKRIRWDGAREILQVIQPDAEAEDAIHTARGHALDALAAVLIAECVRSAESISPTVGQSFREISEEVFGESGGLDASLEKFLNRVLSHKSADLGEYTFQGRTGDTG
ncbi:hypothetical protein ACIRBX_17455 [Kitasatospora sp. NPDC096147]|uniref:hypothetical protein n=1 Tax=Kitasatospora sp. NPDC096147 TaxID=3364093 RepID=UPI0038171DDB